MQLHTTNTLRHFKVITVSYVRMSYHRLRLPRLETQWYSVADKKYRHLFEICHTNMQLCDTATYPSGIVF
jgi:hypothetical protein